MSALRKLITLLLLAFSTTAFAVTDNQVFAYAEANFPGIFTGSATAGQYLQYNYRYYPASGNYLAVDTSGVIYIFGPYTGNVISSVGPVTAYAGYIAAWEATSSAPTVTGKLNDTGITTSQCYQAGSDVLVACGSATAIALNNAQDGMAGRDANAAGNGNTDGKRGFNFSSVTGGCVQDNVTGLMWEIKTADGGLRDRTKTYTNYSTASNPYKLYGTATDASGFVTAVNASNLCGYSDWRLPTDDELQSIVDYSVGEPGPAVDATWFPNTQSGNYYWSASPYVYNPNIASSVSFYTGYSHNTGNRGNGFHVRLVRGGRSQTTPRYTVSADGQEVTDSQTNLIWRRCAEGMNWNGTTCAGIVSQFKLEAALQRAASQASSSGVAWRLPNVKELASIVDKNRDSPAIDPTAFPATPVWGYWSSTPGITGLYYAGGYFACTIDFYRSGNFGCGFSRHDTSLVRLVRAGQ